MQVLYEEEYETHRSPLMGQDNLIKMSISPKLAHKFNTTLTQIQTELLVEISTPVTSSSYFL